MVSNRTEMKETAKRGAWLLRKVALPVLLALLALGFVGMSTGRASASTPQRLATISTQRADSAPALSAYNGTIYASWTGRNAAHNLNLMTYDQTSQSFGPAIIFTDTTLVGAGPSLAIFNGNLCVAWMGTNHHLNVAFFKPGDPTHLANKVTLSETSYNAPSIATFNGRLYLSWRGTDGRLNIISSADASTFNTKVTYNISVRTSPTLQIANAFLFMAWEDSSASSYIVFAHYNPSNPAVLNAVVTTTTSSTLPVSLFTAGVPAPDLRVAWTASDTHINLGYYGGSPTFTGTVRTARTSPYGPALYAPYLSWTGTNAAQNVNVSQVNNF